VGKMNVDLYSTLSQTRLKCATAFHTSMLVLCQTPANTMKHGHRLVHHVVFLFTSPAFACTHCTYSRRDGQAEKTWAAGSAPRWFTCRKTVTHPSTNWARCSASLLIKTIVLRLSQIADVKLKLQFGVTGLRAKALSPASTDAASYQMHLQFAVFAKFI